MKHKFEKFKNLSTENSLKIENCKLKILTVGLLAIILVNAVPAISYATTSTNNNYSLEINDINTAPEKSEESSGINGYQSIRSTDPKSNDAIGGMKSFTQLAPLTFHVSVDVIDFGILSPGNPVIRNSTLTTQSSLIDYQVLAFEDHPLTLGTGETSTLGTSDNEIIADTTCDNGACTELKEALWQNQLTYGLGFRCESRIDFLCLGFTDENTYKQLADMRKAENPQTVIIGQKSEKNKEAQISLKLNTSGNQKTGSYSNTVTFILVPNY